jgi:Common central domain of tyrosinase/Polyphenol oxidase middle domain
MQMTNHSSRRQFLASAGAVASATLFGSCFFDAGPVQGAMLVVRRDVGNMDADDPILDSYRRAIHAMRALPDSNPLSWTYQAAIHWTTLSPSPLPTAWDTCEHGTEFFWSWHRMYLYWFERIIRKMCGDPCWALPYWNWAPGTELQLPAPFRDTSSELFTSNRNPNMNSGAGSLNPLGIDIGPAFSQTNFMSANGIIQGPHGSVHVQVGGWMSDPSTAAQDPIFFLHHSNVDRQWNLWLAQGGGRTDPLNDSVWKTRQHTFFDENGNEVHMTACDILRAAQQLNYVYESEPPQVKEFCRLRFPWWEYVREVVFRLPIPPVELKSEPVSFPIELREVREKILPLLERKDESLLLELDDVEAENNPGVSWAVFVGLPEGKEPQKDSPAYVGSFSLFGVGIRSQKHHEFKPAHFEFPINRAMQAALRANVERVPVTFLPVGIIIDGKPSRPAVKSPVRIGKASLTRETRKEHKE